jgi:hypothetical protein
VPAPVPEDKKEEGTNKKKKTTNKPRSKKSIPQPEPISDATSEPISDATSEPISDATSDATNVGIAQKKKNQNKPRSKKSIPQPEPISDATSEPTSDATNVGIAQKKKNQNKPRSKKLPPQPPLTPHIDTHIEEVVLPLLEQLQLNENNLNTNSTEELCEDLNYHTDTDTDELTEVFVDEVLYYTNKSGQWFNSQLEPINNRPY